MKKALWIVLITNGMLASTLSYGHATIKTLTLVNHYNDTLHFYVNRHHHIVPDLPHHFALTQSGNTSTRVIKSDQEYASSAYISINSFDKTAFLSVNSEEIHGYIDKGIAFSWNTKDHASVTFCTPEAYRQKQSC